MSRTKEATIYDYTKMCNAMDNCLMCPLNDSKSRCGVCVEMIRDNTDTANEIILKWCDEHPLKTYLQDFKEKFPKARLDANGIPNGICIKDTYGPHLKCGDKITCIACWNQPMESDNNA